MDLRYFKVSGHDHGDHSFREVEEVRVMEDGEGPGTECFDGPFTSFLSQKYFINTFGIL